jgi:hypothetical protein
MKLKYFVILLIVFLAANASAMERKKIWDRSDLR